MRGGIQRFLESRNDHLCGPDAVAGLTGPSGQLSQRNAEKFQRPDAPVPGDRTPPVHCSCVRSCGDRDALRAEVSSGRFRRPVRGDRTRPVEKTELWELSGLDRTPGVKRLSFLICASGHEGQVTVEFEWIQDLRVRSLGTCASGHLTQRG